MRSNNTSIGFGETEKRLQLLYQITSQPKKGLNEQLDNALELTTKLLEMEIGIISSISKESDTYTIRNFFPDDSGLSVGQTFDLGNTYCSITLESDDVIAINHMKESAYERHPCYNAFSLEAYIGIPIIIDGELYGTINFSSPNPKEGGFVPSDFTLMKLLSEWVAATIKRARIVKALKEKNERLELISRNSADLICLHNMEGVYTFISPSVENILGFTYKELLGKNHADLIHKEDLEMLMADPQKELEENGVITNTGYRIRNKKGEYIWFESSVSTIKDPDGKSIGLQSISRDITARKKLELMFENAQEMAHVGGWEFDLITGKISWTDEVYRIHDKEIGSELILEEGMDHFPGESRDKLAMAINKATMNHEKYDLVLPFISEKKVFKWVRAIGEPHIVDGNVVRLSGTFQDISKQVNYEKRIIAQNEELLRLTETRDKLYSIIAHDLKGAFFGINGLIELLIDELKESKTKARIEKSIKTLSLVHLSSKNAYELLENLLDWIRVQNGQISVDKEKVNIAKLLTDSISIFETSAAKKEVAVNVQSSDIHIMGDVNMLSTVFRNLISNAIKYSEKGDEIKVGIIENGHSIAVSIKDSGIGMTSEIKDQLFDKNNRPQRRGTLSEKGTGLGLLLCKELVEAHNGTITVISEENKGSEFIVNLPKL
ncbi:MAG: PAS domain S-box protein [Balneola sp.]|nr:PAS domain S-box protein [Balneola sp.]MBO6650483.1 PAS domain S-box protein [Balneola sp.]MBO6711480.1 PAS domain S-box protein [Balneola sp.]MBO6799676.1 PAS domain S-box protein [Balneola sp.]MBO6870883.1 PAS domain S-box protein [Balneola sp.]